MSLPVLSVSIEITPHNDEISIEELNTLFAGEVASFEQWFLEHQRARGILAPTPLISAEHAIVRSFMFYLHTKDSK